MMAYNEVCLRCSQLANASRVLGNLGDDILSKMTLKSGVGTIVETGSDDGHFMAVRGPITLRHLRFRLTDLEGKAKSSDCEARRCPSCCFKKYFPSKKTDEASATGAKAKSSPGRKNKSKPAYEADSSAQEGEIFHKAQDGAKTAPKAEPGTQGSTQPRQSVPKAPKTAPKQQPVAKAAPKTVAAPAPVQAAPKPKAAPKA